MLKALKKTHPTTGLRKLHCITERVGPPSVSEIEVTPIVCPVVSVCRYEMTLGFVYRCQTIIWTGL